MIMNIFGISFFMLLSILAGLGMLALWIWALVDVLRSSISSNEKILWVLVLLFFNVIGVFVYFLSKEGKLRNRGRKEKLQKSSDDYIVAGVCGGFARYLHIDSTILRLLVVLFSIVSAGTIFVLYIVAALIMPSDKKKGKEKKSSKALTTVLISITTILVIAILTTAVVVVVAISTVATDAYTDGQFIEYEDSSRVLDYTIAQFSAHHVIRDHETFKTLEGDELKVKSVQSLDSCYDKYTNSEESSHCFEVLSTFVATDSGILYIANATVAEGMVQSVLIEPFSSSASVDNDGDIVAVSSGCKNCSLN